MAEQRDAKRFAKRARNKFHVRSTSQRAETERLKRQAMFGKEASQIPPAEVVDVLRKRSKIAISPTRVQPTDVVDVRNDDDQYAAVREAGHRFIKKSHRRVNVLEHVIENNGICTPIQRGGREGLLANVKTTTQSDGDHGLTRLEADEPSPSRHQASDVAITAAERCGVVTGPHLVLIDQRAVF